jgi:molecular chaperone GrpE
VSRPDSSAKPEMMGDPDQVVVRDKRRLDPESGTVREPAAERPAAPAADASPPDADSAPAAPGAERVAELTADLQRVSAEYANYRKRVERDRVAVVEMSTAGLLSELLPLLDDIERARQHGDLAGPFLAVGEGLETVTGKLGLERFGEVGEPFDPAVHEALMQAEPDPAATVATCAMVLQPGYRLNSGRVLRPARVAVAEPAAAGAGESEPAPADAPDAEAVE